MLRKAEQWAQPTPLLFDTACGPGPTLSLSCTVRGARLHSGWAQETPARESRSHGGREYTAN